MVCETLQVLIVCNKENICTILTGTSSLEVSKKISSNPHKNAAIIMTDANAVDIAIKSLKLEVSDNVIKPSNLDEVHGHNKCEVEEAWKWLCEESDYEGLPYAQLEENGIQVMEDYFQEMDAIARGVEVRNDLSIGWSNLIIQESVDIARSIEIPDEVIQEWKVRREAICSERNRRIENTLQKLRQSKSAQLILSLINPDLYAPKPYVSIN